MNNGNNRSSGHATLFFARAVLVLALPASFSSTYAQSGPRYLITDMTTGSGVSLDELNHRVSGAGTLARLETVLREAMSTLDEGYVRYRDRASTPSRRIYWIAAGKSTTDDLATLASRGDLLDQVTTLDELDSLFNDTMAVAHGLAVRLAIPHHPAVEGEWLLYWTTPGGADFTPLVVPVRGDSLLIMRGLFGAGAGPAVEVVLRNTRLPDANLGHAMLLFLNEAQRRELRAWNCARLREQPDLSRKQQLDLCARMVRAVHGRGHGPDLATLLCR